MLLARFSSSFTTQFADHGVYAVFALLALGALLPVGSELVSLVAGAVAAGVLTGAHSSSGVGTYVALSLAATAGYLLGCLIGWLIGRFGGRQLLGRDRRL